MIGFNNVYNSFENDFMPFLENISFEINNGEVAYFVHDTLPCFITEMFRGIYYPKQGSIIVDGVEIKKGISPPIGLVNVVGIVDIEEFKLIPYKSVYENMELIAILLNISVKKRKKMITEILSFIGIEDYADMTICNLSKEKQHLVVIARTMIKDFTSYIINLSHGLNCQELRCAMEKLCSIDKAILAYLHENELEKYDSWLIGKRVIRIKKQKLVFDGIYEGQRV